MVKAKVFGHTFPIRSWLIRRVNANASIGFGVLACVMALSAPPSHGAPIVVKDLSFEQGGTVFLPVPDSVPFDFRIYEPSPGAIVSVVWREQYSPADIGKSFFAPPEVIAAATAALSSTTAVWDVEVNKGGFNFHGGLWSFGFPPNYNITAIERLIDDLVITPIHETRFTLHFAHRIRVWAAPIPEPITMAYLGLGVGYFAMFRIGGRRRTTTTSHTL